MARILTANFDSALTPFAVASGFTPTNGSTPTPVEGSGILQMYSATAYNQTEINCATGLTTVGQVTYTRFYVQLTAGQDTECFRFLILYASGNSVDVRSNGTNFALYVSSVLSDTSSFAYTVRHVFSAEIAV